MISSFKRMGHFEPSRKREQTTPPNSRLRSSTNSCASSSERREGKRFLESWKRKAAARASCTSDRTDRVGRNPRFGNLVWRYTRELWDKRPSLSSAKLSGSLYFDHQQYQIDTMLIPWCHAYHGPRFTFLKQDNLLTQAQKQISKHTQLTVPTP